MMNFHAVFVLSVPSEENRKRNERPALREIGQTRTPKRNKKVTIFFFTVC